MSMGSRDSHHIWNERACPRSTEAPSLLLDAKHEEKWEIVTGLCRPVLQPFRNEAALLVRIGRCPVAARPVRECGPIDVEPTPRIVVAAIHWSRIKERSRHGLLSTSAH